MFDENELKEIYEACGGFAVMTEEEEFIAEHLTEIEEEHRKNHGCDINNCEPCGNSTSYHFDKPIVYTTKSKMTKKQAEFLFEHQGEWMNEWKLEMLSFASNS